MLFKLSPLFFLLVLVPAGILLSPLACLVSFLRVIFPILTAFKNFLRGFYCSRRFPPLFEVMKAAPAGAIPLQEPPCSPLYFIKVWSSVPFFTG